MDGGSAAGADFLATRDDIEQEWVSDQRGLFNASLHEDYAEVIVGYFAGVA
jgi:hypothetical protein